MSSPIRLAIADEEDTRVIARYVAGNFGLHERIVCKIIPDARGSAVEVRE